MHLEPGKGFIEDCECHGHGGDQKLQGDDGVDSGDEFIPGGLLEGVVFVVGLSLVVHDVLNSYEIFI